MFKLIIVDDEEMALRGLADYVDWRSMGYELAGTARTIAGALELVERQPVDVVLTDIQLEDESGLDLVGQLSRSHPRIRCVILSGHGEFEYARQALRYGAFDFLTKPVQFDALRRTFAGLSEQLQQDGHAAGIRKEYLELKRARFFNNLAKEKQPVFDPAVAQELGIQPEGALLLARVRLDEAGLRGALLEGAKQKLRRAMQGAFGPLLRYEVFSNTLDQYAVLFYGCGEGAADALLGALESAFPTRLSIGVSRVFHTLAGLSAAYFEAGKAMDYRLLRHSGSVVFYSIIQDSLYKKNALPEQVEAELNSALTQKDANALWAVADREMAAISRGSDSLNYLYSFCIELHLLVDRFLRNYLSGYTGGDLAESIRRIVLRDSPDALRAYVKEYIFSLQELIAQAAPYVSDTVQSMQEYIHEHYAEEVTLQALANQFFLHPNYLSKLFTEKTGQNFIEYLTQVRVENAKKLLRETGLKVYDVSQMVGYESPKYFSRVFKELTGLTPREYRERQGG